MRLNWRQRLKIEPDLKDISNWPHIDFYNLKVAKRKSYNRNHKILMRSLSEMKLSEVAKLACVDPSFVTYLLNRCLGGNEGHRPALTAGLVPSMRIRKSTRSIKLSENCDSGAQGAFQMILREYPAIKERLDQLLIDFIKRSNTAENITPGRFHREFIRLLEEINWPKNRYPFDTNSRAYETCRKYYKQRLSELRLPKPSKHKHRVIVPKAKYAYEEVQIDAWLVDLTTSLDVVLDDRLIPIKVARFMVYVATDVATGCNLSYHIALTAHPTKEDILSVIEKIHLPWKARKLRTKGVRYLPGAGFPSALDEIYQYAGIGMIRLDNALAHHANAIRDFVCNRLGCTLNLGIPGQPKARGAVEYVFKQLSELALRFASATGNHPKHPLKETKKNASSPPKLKLHEFEDILDVTLSSYNSSNRQIAGGNTPLNLVRYQMETCFLALIYDGSDGNRSPFIRSEIKNIVFLQNEQRAPFIRFESFRYNGQCLRETNLLGKEIKIEYDPRDIRTVRAYELDGKFVGEIKAPMTQQHFPLSIQTLKLMRKRTVGSSGLVASTVDEYFVELSKNLKSPKSNLELARLAREIFPSDDRTFNVSQPITKPIPSANDGCGSNVKTIPKWSTKLARRGN